MSQMEEKGRGVILFGGTFNPIHKGHIRLCCSAAAAVQPRLVVLMPAAPFYKELETTPADRLEMCKRAVADLPFPVRVSDYELRQGAKWRTYDTLIHIRELIGDEPLYLLFGSDTFLSFSYWYRWRECGRLISGLLVGMRKSDRQETVILQQELLEKEGIAVTLLEHPGDPISSEKIRAAVQTQAAVLDDAVYAYILEHHLYHT